jgi:hypothetical protein
LFNSPDCTLIEDGTDWSTCSATITYTPASSEGSPHTITAVYTPLDASWATSQVTYNVTVDGLRRGRHNGRHTP